MGICLRIGSFLLQLNRKYPNLLNMTEEQTTDLLADIEAFCAARGLADSAFGAEAMGDPSFVFDLRNGREPRRKTVQKARDYMKAARRMPA